MSYATVMFDLEQHGEDQLARALRTLPVGGSIKLATTGLELNKIAGPVGFRLVTPQRIGVRPHIEPRALQSVTTAAPALAEAHRQVLERREQGRSE